MWYQWDPITQLAQNIIQWHKEISDGFQHQLTNWEFKILCIIGGGSWQVAHWEDSYWKDTQDIITDDIIYIIYSVYECEICSTRTNMASLHCGAIETAQGWSLPENWRTFFDVAKLTFFFNPSHFLVGRVWSWAKYWTWWLPRVEVSHWVCGGEVYTLLGDAYWMGALLVDRLKSQTLPVCGPRKIWFSDSVFYEISFCHTLDIPAWADKLKYSLWSWNVWIFYVS